MYILIKHACYTIIINIYCSTHKINSYNCIYIYLCLHIIKIIYPQL